MSNERQINILLMVTGSVAAIKLPNLIRALQNVSSVKFNIRVALTQNSLNFFHLEEVTSLLPESFVYDDEKEWKKWKVIGDPVLHIDLRSWADIGVVAPLDANTLGKISSGICDNLVSSIIRAWDLSKPLVIAPAMNVHMWNHPLTDRGLKVCAELGYIQVGPISKKLACGDVGMGAMAEVEQIVERILKLV